MIYSVCAESREAPAVPEGVAILVEGTRPAKGMPGFGKNAIPCLEGVYRLDNGLAVTVRVTREPLVFRDELWKKTDGYSRAAREGSEGGSTVIVSESAPGAREGFGGSGRWYYAISFDAGTDAAERARFFEAFAPKADEFVMAASRPADVSLPAILRMRKR